MSVELVEHWWVACAPRPCGRPPGLGSIPRQKSLDSSLAAQQMNQQAVQEGRMGRGAQQGSARDLYSQ